MRLHTRFRAQRGLTLIELMVAMTIGLMLLAGTAQLFVTNKRIYQEQEELSLLQENGRFALDMLINDIRMAGYVGCHDIMANVTNHVTTTATDLRSFVARLEGFEGGEATWLPSAATANLSTAGGSDAITVRYVDPLQMTLTLQSTAGAATALAVSGSSDPRLQNGDLIALGDCANSEVFAITATPTPAAPAALTGIPNGAVMARPYAVGSPIMRFVARRYFVQSDADGPALWMVQNGGGAQKVIDGVETMQVMYGVDGNDADTLPDSYVTADTLLLPADWETVVSVRVALLMRTASQNPNNTVDNRTYGVLGGAFGPYGDQRRRRIFTATIALRNNT